MSELERTQAAMIQVELQAINEQFKWYAMMLSKLYLNVTIWLSTKTTHSIILAGGMSYYHFFAKCDLDII